jgi:phosphohistidine phosphatase
VVVKLYLVQHGEARSENEDPQRALSPNGENEVRKVAQAAKHMALTPSKIFHSRKLRAGQTAEILAEALGKPVEAVNGLAPMDNVQPWVNRIARGEEELMLVGHLPFMEKITSFLITGDEESRPVLFRFGAIVCLEQKEDQRWGIRWILTPEMVSNTF